mmetsp:Transcript_27283/g.54938  ORF Transcript_27283/g.54938 Transcript_27283/m.54938 type:complete len:201 (-) Transcript_27283:323-925(-)|eukprot:CAMPEP_0174755540 /NCGR_PEP_ID=MMETSP1094-20130205/106298_1 /TAXON_ID=156173 /ORGANISM="Chrysochromulina brevifilum, Strain UTEX LB 985" /LENGTH=200 /DNA_ID=CAMNT_0015961429 /DNA_START=31 /DNA_END=633 /DNA_ORIENTATION=+
MPTASVAPSPDVMSDRWPDGSQIDFEALEKQLESQVGTYQNVGTEETVKFLCPMTQYIGKHVETITRDENGGYRWSGQMTGGAQLCPCNKVQRYELWVNDDEAWMVRDIAKPHSATGGLKLEADVTKKMKTLPKMNTTVTRLNAMTWVQKGKGIDGMDFFDTATFSADGKTLTHVEKVQGCTLWVCCPQTRTTKLVKVDG